MGWEGGIEVGIEKDDLKTNLGTSDVEGVVMAARSWWDGSRYPVADQDSEEGQGYE